MTTAITVLNHDNSQHDIELTFAGQKVVVKPGDHHTTHIWASSGLSIAELPIAKPAQPDASEAKVYTPEGVEIPMRRGMGANPPDEKYMGMTPDQLLAYRQLNDRGD